MNRSLRTGLVVLSAVMVGVGCGCTPHPDTANPTTATTAPIGPTSPPTSTSPGSETPAPTTAPILGPTGCGASAATPVVHLAVADAKPAGDLVNVTGTLPPVADQGASGELPDPDTLAADGSYATRQVHTTQERELEGRPDIGLVRGDSQTKIDQGAKVSDSGYQAPHISRLGDNLAWIETTSVSPYWEDWVVYANMGGTTTLVANSYEVSDNGQTSIVNGGARPSLTPSFVYWNSMVPDTTLESGYRPVLYYRAVDGTGDLGHLDDVTLHTTDDKGNLYYVRNDPQSATFQIVQRHDDGTETQAYCGQLQPGQSVTDIYAGSGGLAWGWVTNTHQEGVPKTLGIQALHNGTLYDIDAPAGAYSVSLSGNLAAWGSGSGMGDPKEYVANLATGQIIWIGEFPGYSTAAVAGNHLIWNTPSDNGSRSPTTTFGTLNDAFAAAK